MTTQNAVPPRAPRPFLLGSVLLLSAGWLAAPLSHASVKGVWSDGAARDQTFARVLVVGITPDLNMRCRFERALAARLRSNETEAIVSCDVISREDPLTREIIEAAVAAENVDAVLATSLISREWESQEGGSRETAGDAYYKAIDTYYGIYGSVVAVEFQTSEPVTTIRGKLELTSKLYETEGGTVVYTLDSKVSNVESIGDGLYEITEPVSKKLLKEGLIR